MARGATALITGAASGIGRALALELAERGIGRLVLLDLDRDGLEALAASLGKVRVDTVVLDIGDEAALEAAFARLAAEGTVLDLLFNNAGIPAGTPSFPETGLPRIRAILETNLLGLIFVTSLALPLMRKPGGSILNTASVSGLRPYLTGAVYAASKAGAIMFTRSCADLQASMGVRVNAICPGIVDTPFLDKTGVGGKRAAWLQARLAAGGVLGPADVARAAIDLALDPDRAGTFEVLEA